MNQTSSTKRIIPLLLALGATSAYAQQAPSTDGPDYKSDLKQAGMESAEIAAKYYTQKAFEFFNEKRDEKRCEYIKQEMANYLNIPIAATPGDQQINDKKIALPAAEHLANDMLAHKETGDFAKTIYCIQLAMQADTRTDRHEHVEFLTEQWEQPAQQVLDHDQKMDFWKTLGFDLIAGAGGAALPEFKLGGKYAAGWLAKAWIGKAEAVVESDLTKTAGQIEASFLRALTKFAPEEAAAAQAEMDSAINKGVLALRAAGASTFAMMGDKLLAYLKLEFKDYFVQEDVDAAGKPLFTTDVLEKIEVKPIAKPGPKKPGTK